MLDTILTTVRYIGLCKDHIYYSADYDPAPDSLTSALLSVIVTNERERERGGDRVITQLFFRILQQRGK